MGELTVGKLVDELKARGPMRVDGMLFRHIRDFTSDEWTGAPPGDRPGADTDNRGGQW